MSPLPTLPTLPTPPIHSSTVFLGAAEAAALVRHHGIAATLAGMAQEIRADFLRWGAFDKSARVATHSPDGVIELMPIADDDCYSFKYVNGHPRNFTQGLPTVMAFGVLADVATGAPRFVSELTLTTALRTAAVSALAAQALARPGGKVMALIGNGAQSEFQALAFAHLLGIEELRLYDVDADATHKLQRHLAGVAVHGRPLRTVACGSTAEAVRGADIVTTVTADKASATILTPDLLAPGMHINAVGGDCPGKTELHPGVLQAASVFVEYEPQTRIEGDLQQMPADFAVTELWRVLAHEHPGRRGEEEITVFDSVGFALEDFSALRWMRRAAEALGMGAPLDLIPSLANPKDLFGLVADRAARQTVPPRRQAPAGLPVAA